MEPEKNATASDNPGSEPARRAGSARTSASSEKAAGGSVRLLVLGVLLALCAILYYFGEIVDLFGWNALRWGFFYSVHDVQRLMFLAPVTYAAYVFGMRATLIVTLLALAAMLPRALFVSPYPDPLLRMLLSVLIMGALGYLVARNRRLEAATVRDRDTLFGILERMGEGVVVVGPDYRVRFANAAMSREFGVSAGCLCYESIYDLGAPCPGICRLKSVLAGSVERWQYVFPDGRTYEIVASPFTDQDGTVCSMATYRDAFADSLRGD